LKKPTTHPNIMQINNRVPHQVHTIIVKFKMWVRNVPWRISWGTQQQWYPCRTISRSYLVSR